MVPRARGFWGLRFSAAILGLLQKVATKDTFRATVRTTERLSKTVRKTPTEISGEPQNQYAQRSCLVSGFS